MPKIADYESFRRIINKLPDTDVPSVFCLPDNIERSLQRVTSTGVIKQLLALSTLDAEANKFDREKWRAQLGPVLELWQQLTSSTPGLLNKKSKDREASNIGAAGSDKEPLEDFVGMESDLAGDLCTSVDSALGALKKVLFGSGLLTPVIQAAATALLSGTVPSDWTKKWEGGPEKPQNWLRELVRKRIALTKWRSASAKGAGGLLAETLVLGIYMNIHICMYIYI
jgi:dynein heavy chain 2